MKISKALLILFILGLNCSLFASEFSNKSQARYQYVTVVKEMLVQRAINVSDIASSTPFDYIKVITKQAIDNIKYDQLPLELNECVNILKTDLEQRNIYMSQREIVETIVAAVNS